MTTFVSFARRRNHDQSIDSICTRCYQTIASADHAHDLDVSESTHLCDPEGEFNRLHARVSKISTSSTEERPTSCLTARVVVNFDHSTSSFCS